MLRLPLVLLVVLVACRAEGDPKFVPDVDGDGIAAEDDCDDSNPDASAWEDWYIDDDGDGYGTRLVTRCGDPGEGYAQADGDCDDTDAAVSPGAVEACNGIDDDCDGETDEDLATSTWYTDADGDGYGENNSSVDACSAPEGAVDQGDDCDDADASTHPGADETCTDTVDHNCDGSVGYADLDGDGYAACLECNDGDAAIHPDAAELCNEVDDDCDGTVDEDAVDGTTWYADVDGDGYGDLSAPTTACTAPAGYVEDASDCDDGQSDVHPDAAELCNDRDDDCDGEVDEDGTDATAWYLDADGDGWGDDGTAVTSCTAPDGYVALAGDCDDADAAYNPGATEADCTDPNDYNCDGSVGYADADGDGVVACEDCDDAAATVFPGAEETCDGVDDDCDGAIDEAGATGGATWYADLDGDTYGDAASPVDACAAPEGYVEDATDCDDRDAGVNPAGAEVCNGLDDDCDGVVDDGAFDPTTWYGDADGDGYGDDAVSVSACTAPDGYVTLGGDCDDTDPAFNPGASETDCSDPTDYNCDGSVGYVDGDGDGWAACEDCDDGDAGVHPGAVEVCDGVDDDCDSTVDVGAADAQTWHVDGDGDGYGGAGTTTACDAPSGYVDDATDCDDTLGDVHPDALELCNGIDDDCDSVVDDGAADPTTWYVDADGDGWGDATTAVSACDAPAGAVPTAGDCDDTDSAVHPGATETCTDAVDLNCDGSVSFADADGDGWAACEECDDTNSGVNPGAAEVCDGLDDDCNGVVDDALTAPTWYADEDGDGYGGTSSTSACTAPDGWVGTSTDCDDGVAGVHPGAAEVCDGVDDDCDGAIDEAGAGGETTWYVDSDGDGWGGAGTTTSCTAPAGYVDVGGDCVDSDASAHPGGLEVCDLVDNDCNGVADDSPSDGGLFLVDADGDGFAGTDTVVACEAPASTSSTGGDCDDGDAAVSPDATEVCNGVDDDCDGAVDESGGTTWYADADGDGFGDPDSPTVACDAPAGTVADATDCDDTAGDVSPAGTETCDGVDENCDGTIDDGSVCSCPTYTYGGHSYQFCTAGAAWYSAQAACEATGYELVQIDDSDENTWVIDVAYTFYSGKWWTGYTDGASEGTWLWPDGTSGSFTNWHADEPNDSGGNEDCMQLGRFGDYTWNDEPCTSAFDFICEAG